MVGDDLHSALSLSHHLVLIDGRVAFTILLGHLHAVFLHRVHHSHHLLLLPLQHLLQGLLLRDRVQRNISVDTIVVFLLMREHYR